MRDSSFTQAAQIEHSRKELSEKPGAVQFQRELFPGGGASGDTGAINLAEPTTPYGTKEEDNISRLVDITQRVFLVVERELRLTGFWESIPARNKLKADIQNVLLAPEFALLPGLRRKRAHIISRIMEIAEKNNDTILYAD